MSEHNEPGIAPALTAEQWGNLRQEGWVESAHPTMHGIAIAGGALQAMCCGCEIEAEHIPAAIAMANYLLPDGDPRKLTWDMVRALEGVAAYADQPLGDNAKLPAFYRRNVFWRIAAAIASYLPPEVP